MSDFAFVNLWFVHSKDYTLDGVYRSDTSNMMSFIKVDKVPAFVKCTGRAKKLFWFVFWMKKYTYYKNITKDKCMTVAETYFFCFLFFYLLQTTKRNKKKKLKTKINSNHKFELHYLFEKQTSHAKHFVYPI